MYCRKCGAKLNDNSKFCTKCGANVMTNSEETEVVQPKIEESVAPLEETLMKETDLNETKEATKSTPLQSKIASNDDKKKKIHKKNHRVTAIGCFIVVIIVIIGTVVGNKIAHPTIKLADYTTVEVEGYNGIATATVNVDWDAIETKYEDKIKLSNEFSDKLSEYGFSASVASYYSENSIEYLKTLVGTEVDQTNDLSNDGVVTVNYSLAQNIEDYFNCSVDTTAYTYTVSGLEEVETFDAFEKLDVEFSGVNGEGKISYNYTGDEDLSFTDDSGTVSYSTTGELSNGDEVTISISISDADSFVANYGYLPKEMSKTYAVSGLSKYCTKIADIPEDAKSILKAQAEDSVKAYFSRNTQSYTITYIGDYFESKKSSSSVNYGQNGYAVMYKVDFVDYYSTVTETVYVGELFKNITFTEDGNSNASELNCYQIGGIGWVYGEYTSLEDFKKNEVDVDSADYTIEWNVNE